MRLKSIGFFTALAILGASAGSVDAAPRYKAVAKLVGLDGREIGRADFQQVSRGVLIEIRANNLPPGAHAVLIHATARCDAKTKFADAGTVLDFNPPRPHGYYVVGGPRPGDLPTQFAGADGVLHATMFTSTISLGGGKKTLFDRDGATIVIHERGDDYRSAWDGNSGARIACGVIVRTVGPKPRHKRPAEKKK